MAKRAKKSAPIDVSGSRTQLGSVKPGHRARLLDNSIVLVAASIGGRVFVRDDSGTGHGPYEMPNETVVVEVMAPELVAQDRSEVVDPLA